MAENKVYIDGGGVGISTSEGTVNVAVPGPGQGAMLCVTNGQLIPFTTLDAVAANTTGSTMDCGASHQVCSAVSVSTGTLTGTVTIEASVDGTSWVSTGSTIAVTAASTLTATSTGKAFRYYRASLSGVANAGTVTVKLMANG